MTRVSYWWMRTNFNTDHRRNHIIVRITDQILITSFLQPNVALMVFCTPSNNICCALFRLTFFWIDPKIASHDDTFDPEILWRVFKLNRAEKNDKILCCSVFSQDFNKMCANFQLGWCIWSIVDCPRHHQPEEAAGKKSSQRKVIESGSSYLGPPCLMARGE